ncbi:hypothetical protein R4P64_31010 [Rhodococcus sp. IEGM 1366]|nr:hypothetical protein [Rhodococcus sp. IEGM 1366]MDV8070956.1 hypothetical protein [Rhodococcus sp. IEGM 1366]
MRSTTTALNSEIFERTEGSNADDLPQTGAAVDDALQYRSEVPVAGGR